MLHIIYLDIYRLLLDVPVTVHFAGYHGVLNGCLSARCMRTDAVGFRDMILCIPRMNEFHPARSLESRKARLIVVSLLPQYYDGEESLWRLTSAGVCERNAGGFPCICRPMLPGLPLFSGGTSRARAGLVGGVLLQAPKSPRIGANGAAENVLQRASRKEMLTGDY